MPTLHSVNLDEDIVLKAADFKRRAKQIGLKQQKNRRGLILFVALWKKFQ